MSNVIDFTLGADPEFICLKKGRFFRSDNTPFYDLQDEFGGDHSGRPFEVRPNPSVDPLEVVTNIHSILVGHTLRYPEFYRDYEWKAGSYFKTKGGEDDEGHDTGLGGHIHIGGLKRILPAKHAAPILDNYVGLISILVEDREEGMMRRDCDCGGGGDGGGYGYASDTRSDVPYGYEYRTPSSWLTSPYVAAGFLCLTKAILWEVVNNKEFKAIATDLSGAFETMDTKALKQHYKTAIWPSIQKLTLYPNYQSYIDFLHFLIIHNLTWYPKVSMKEAWGIANPSIYPERRPTLAAIWKKYGAGDVVEKKNNNL